MATLAVHLDDALHQRLISHIGETASADQVISQALHAHFDDLEADATVIPSHDALIPGYRLPVTPEGYDKPCAINCGQNASYKLDFVNMARRDFASESMEVNLAWPWRTGFRPHPTDWESIGFVCLI